MICFQVSLPPQQFEEDANSPWNPLWWAMGHGCSISLSIKPKLKVGGSIQILSDRKLSKRVSLLKELWQLHHGMQKSTDLDAHLVARQSTWTPTATRCKNRGRLFTGRDMNVCREVLNFHKSSANQHSKRLIQESLQSLHCDLPDQTPIVLTLTRLPSFVRAAEATPEVSPIPL
jgi:hypothetical protein